MRRVVRTPASSHQLEASWCSKVRSSSSDGAVLVSPELRRFGACHRDGSASLRPQRPQLRGWWWRAAAPAVDSATAPTSSVTVATTAAPTFVTTAPEAVPKPVTVVTSVPHDPAAFTQGLVFDESGRLFESTGLLGQSTLREVDPATGAVLREQALDPTLFGEGLALVDDRLVQLTYRNGRRDRLRQGDLRAGRHVRVRGRGLGPLLRRRPAGDEQRQRRADVPGSDHVRRRGIGERDRGQRTADAAERARVRRRRRVRERLADEHPREDRPDVRSGGAGPRRHRASRARRRRTC